MEYEWDTRHQLRRAIQTAGDTAYQGAFVYGDAGRLSAVDVALGTTDPKVLANTRVPQRNVEYRYDPVDPQRLDQLLNLDGKVYADYDYDAAGNVIRRTVGNESWDLRYDGENRLRQVIYTAPNGSTQQETFYYDGANRVLSVRGNGKLRRWFGNAELRYLQNGATLDKSLYRVMAGQPVARIEDADQLEYLVQTPQGHEALSMSVDTSTGAATVQMGKLYGPFGEVLYSELGAGKDAEDYTKEF